MLFLSIILLLTGKYHLLVSHLERGKTQDSVAAFSSGRIQIWSNVLENYSYYIFGNGYAVGFREGHILGNTNAHNSMVEVLTGQGILGVFAWIYMFVRILCQFKSMFRYRKNTTSYLSALCCLMYILISSMTNVRCVYLGYGMLILIGVIIYLEKERCAVGRRKKQTWRRLTHEGAEMQWNRKIENA